MTVTVRDIENAVAAAFPPERAEAWDRVGLLCGDPHAVVDTVACALDPTTATVAAAAAAGAQVLLTHHPAFLSPPQVVRPGAPGGGGVVFAAIEAGVALINAHTNLDRDPAAQALIPQALGLEPLSPLETSSQPRGVVTVYLPAEAVDRVTDAMAGAGAGRVGDYRSCTFAGRGTGSYTAGASSQPWTGAPGERSSVDEVRLEMVCPESLVDAVVAAAVREHPYEEPLVVASRAAIAPNREALGMVCSADTTLAALAVHAGRCFGVTPRVWGDPGLRLERVATATGSAGSLVGAARAAGAQALVAGEVRYHDALAAVEAGLCVIELGHDVSEWPLVALLEQAVRAAQAFESVSVIALPADAAWWTPDT